MSRTPTVVSVRMTDQLAADLEVLQRDGMDASAAIRHAVRLVAGGQRYADLQAAGNGGRRPGVLSIPTSALYAPRPPYDGAEQGV
ncbi:hypothetical protein [Streptomyces dysideae]|uniref:Uncharacterized protein n=1 Tax=Streptomyces dysideae TaxID=909626 RepID=A0A101V2X6_9ACTN|nr:hypothetical protein [Streptomyces dysideae]KUO21473.1 hypothetical protein AQJ91_09060 [Streptomyces dysideae]